MTISLYSQLTGKRKEQFEKELSRIAGYPVEVEVMDDLTSKAVNGLWYVSTNKDTL